MGQNNEQEQRASAEIVEVSTIALASSVTGFLLGDIGDVYRVIEQVTGIAPFTHQLPRMGRELSAHIKQALPDFPDKAEAEAFPVNGETVGAYVADVLARFGETVAVPKQTVEAQNPIDELVGMVGKERVIVVAQPSSDESPSS